MTAALSLAAFLGLAAACAPDVAPETLADIARVESGFDPLAIGVNGPARAEPRQRPATAAQAAAQARALIERGVSIDLGLMQINSRNLGWLGLSVEDAFDPCRSVAAGARVLTAFSRYNTGSPARGFANGYVARVTAAGQARRDVPPLPRSPETSSAPRSAATVPSWDVWAVPHARRAEPNQIAASPDGAGQAVTLRATRQEASR